MFGNLKVTVIWKYEEDLKNVPKNVHILKWAPQTSILGKYFFSLQKLKYFMQNWSSYAVDKEKCKYRGAGFAQNGTEQTNVIKDSNSGFLTQLEGFLSLSGNGWATLFEEQICWGTRSSADQKQSHQVLWMIATSIVTF